MLCSPAAPARKLASSQQGSAGARCRQSFILAGRGGGTVAYGRCLLFSVLGFFWSPASRAQRLAFSGLPKLALGAPRPRFGGVLRVSPFARSVAASLRRRVRVALWFCSPFVFCAPRPRCPSVVVFCRLSAARRPLRARRRAPLRTVCVRGRGRRFGFRRRPLLGAARCPALVPASGRDIAAVLRPWFRRPLRRRRGSAGKAAAERRCFRYPWGWPPPAPHFPCSTDAAEFPQKILASDVRLWYNRSRKEGG